MNPEIVMAVCSVVSLLISVVVLVVVAPMRKLKTDLDRATAQLALVSNQRFAERLDKLEQRMQQTEDAAFERKEARQKEHQQIIEFIRTEIARSDAESRVARKSIHEDIASVRLRVAELGADVKNTTGWLEKLDERFDAKITELVAATANLSGGQHRG